MKAMTIGISPEYNYPGAYDKWRQDNTYFASNFGGSLITRAIMREFDADYVDDFSDMAALKNRYDTCIMAFATHAHATRSVQRYADIVEKLQMKVIVVSLGLSDYVQPGEENYPLHTSVCRILDIAAESSTWIGVRGPYTASVLHRNGYKDVLPIGCPTIYWNLGRDFPIADKVGPVHKPLVVYHKTLAVDPAALLQGMPLLGQDFQDQAIFTDDLGEDTRLLEMERKFYDTLEDGKSALAAVRDRGIFPAGFDDWFNTIGGHDFVFGPRLHGCIAALIQGVPAVLAYRDLRTREMIEVFNFPSVTYDTLASHTLTSLASSVNFARFRKTYAERYDNYCAFISENGLDSRLIPASKHSYRYLTADQCTFNFLAQSSRQPLREQARSRRSKLRRLIHRLR
ncbi:polysaccharide pyruvyl transferase family protein [Mangrovimicrobium sediminis]|uniref:Polysaccharide pyruvyl transferase family protein n=1 Tax=Mangrovimicrobium sediminis TaxID=2562682 RepID=A0A4Z0M813_9GAMM|nr:polysaccharide pyruvyl transferase family protein [Haliea sp. SAOS-164]TGD75661.1 polysaccharide pyruvyl transferase family protein [Haliea sp. SAOS-164]